MHDPKRLYEDRTPAGLVDAPRDATTRPTFTPDPPKPPRYGLHRKKQRKGARGKRKGYLVWKRKMEARFGKRWRGKWLKLKKLTGIRTFNPDTDDFSALKRGRHDG